MSIKETYKNTRRMEKCPGFDTCEAPKCPLDELVDHRMLYAGEAKCKANKRSRYLLGKDTKHCGLTGIEWGGYLSVLGTEESVRNKLKEEFGNDTTKGVS